MIKDYILENYNKMEPWELLQKVMIWEQLSFVNNIRILDFGSGSGVTANHFAKCNEVIAIEPCEDMINNRFNDNEYVQLKGSLDALKKIDDNYFDMILCHNVLEYTEEREDIVKEFGRILKAGGLLSIVKHNRNGRVMQMVALLNNFEHANELLEGSCGNAEKYGQINYYNNEDIVKWYDRFIIRETYGIRTFWALQQNQEIHKYIQWQKSMLSMEKKVCNIEEFKAVASFHHIILQKQV